MDETNRRREKQLKHNERNNITPKQITKSNENILIQSRGVNMKQSASKAYIESGSTSIAADPVIQYMSSEQLNKVIATTRKNMEKAARELDFIEAARLRDEMLELEKLSANKN